MNNRGQVDTAGTQRLPPYAGHLLQAHNSQGTWQYLQYACSCVRPHNCPCWKLSGVL